MQLKFALALAAAAAALLQGVGCPPLRCRLRCRCAVMGCGTSKPHARQGPYPVVPVAPVPAVAAAASKLAPVSTPPGTKPAPTAPEALIATPAPDASSWDDWDDEDDSSAPSRSQPPATAVAGATPQPTEHAAFRNSSGVLCIGAVAAAAMEVGLRCKSCGQCVHRFEARQWDESADYFTFRNYVRTRGIRPRTSTWPPPTPAPHALLLRVPLRSQAPDERMPHKRQEDLGKLAQWLRPAAGASGGAAYACGCSWQSTVGREAKPIEGEGEGEGVLATPHGGARLGEAEPRLKWVAV